MPDRSAIALAPEGTRSWLGDAVEAGGGTIVEPREADGLVWTDPADPAGLGDAARRPPADRLDPAPVGGHRALRRRRPRPRRADVDLRQGRVRRAGGRARARARRSPGCATSGPTPGARRGAGRRAPTCSARASRSSAAAASPRACCGCSARSAATSPSCGARPAPMDGADRVVGEERARRRPHGRAARRAGPRPHAGHRRASSTGAGSSCSTPTDGW